MKVVNPQTVIHHQQEDYGLVPELNQLGVDLAQQSEVLGFFLFFGFVLNSEDIRDEETAC